MIFSCPLLESSSKEKEEEDKDDEEGDRGEILWIVFLGWLERLVSNVDAGRDERGKEEDGSNDDADDKDDVDNENEEGESFILPDSEPDKTNTDSGSCFRDDDDDDPGAGDDSDKRGDFSFQEEDKE